MLGAHIVVVEVPRLFDGVLDHLLGAGRLGQAAHGDHLGPALTSFSTSRRTLRRSHRGSSARSRRPRTFLHEPGRMCSVPMYSWLKRWASLVGQGHDFACRSVNRSNIFWHSREGESSPLYSHRTAPAAQRRRPGLKTVHLRIQTAMKEQKVCRSNTYGGWKGRPTRVLAAAKNRRGRHRLYRLHKPCRSEEVGCRPGIEATLSPPPRSRCRFRLPSASLAEFGTQKGESRVGRATGSRLRISTRARRFPRNIQDRVHYHAARASPPRDRAGPPVGEAFRERCRWEVGKMAKRSHSRSFQDRWPRAAGHSCHRWPPCLVQRREPGPVHQKFNAATASFKGKVVGCVVTVQRQELRSRSPKSSRRAS